MDSVSAKIMPTTRTSLVVGLSAIFYYAGIYRLIYKLVTGITLFLLAGVTACLWYAVRSDSDKSRHRAEQGRKILRSSTFTTWSTTQLLSQEEQLKRARDHSQQSNLPPAIAPRINALLALIRETFILPWYSRISPEVALPEAVDTLIRSMLDSTVVVGQTVDLPKLAVSRILPIVQDHLRHYRTVEDSPGVSNELLPLPYNAHPALRNQDLDENGAAAAIELHLRSLVSRFVEVTLPPKDRSVIVTIMIREIMLGSVLLPLFDMLCDGDFWNRTIDERGRTYLQESRQVDQFLSALSALQPVTPAQTPRKSPSSSIRGKGSAGSTIITAESSGQQFEAFLRSISRIEGLGDARRLKADVARKLRIAHNRLDMSHGLEEQPVVDVDKSTKRLRKYLNRLERADLAIDAKIAKLANLPQNGPGSRASSETIGLVPPEVASSLHNLRAVLSDPSSLALFLEFMERRGRSRLAQLWLPIGGLKDPLDPLDVLAVTANPERTSLTAPTESNVLASDTQSFVQDVNLLYRSHLPSLDEVTASLLEDSVRTLRRFVEGPTPPSQQDIRLARQAISTCQQAIFQQMETKDWPSFTKTDLFIKAVASFSQVGAANTLQPPLPIAAPAQVQTGVGQENGNATTVSVPLPKQPILSANVTQPEVSQALRGARSPPPRTALSLLQRMSTPRSGAAVAAISLTPPAFDRSVADGPWPGTGQSSPVSTVSQTTILETPSTIPPQPSRKHSQLDFLICQGPIPENEDKRLDQSRQMLFDSDDEAAGDSDAEGLNEEAGEQERIRAIQAALTDIIASRPDEAKADYPQKHDGPTNMSASMVLLDTAQKQHDMARATGDRKAASRSAEDLLSLRTAKATASPASITRVPGTRTMLASSPIRSGSTPTANAASLGRSRLFEEDEDDPDDLESAEDGEEIWQPEIAPGKSDARAEGRIRIAGPGDLQLGPDIVRLQAKIQELVQQDQLLLSMIAQAELKGSSHELRILKRSQVSLRLEQRAAILQKAQFEQQAVENRLSLSTTRISIPSTEVVSEADGKHFVRYHVRVCQLNLGGEQKEVVLAENERLIRSRWTVIRRFNDFWELDRRLRDATGPTALADSVKKRMARMPEKRLVGSLSAAFVEGRRVGIERYLQALLSIQELCEHPLVLAFLSTTDTGSIHYVEPSDVAGQLLAPDNMVQSLHRTAARSSNDSKLGTSTFDLLYTTLSMQLNGVAGAGGGFMGNLTGTDGEHSISSAASLRASGQYTPSWPRADPLASWLPSVTATNANAAVPSSHVPDPIQAQATLNPGENGSSAFSAPICDLLIQLFDLKESNWIRRQAIVFILQQFLGSTVEKKVRELSERFLSKHSIEKAIASLQDAMWPNGIRRPPSVPRSSTQKTQTRHRAAKLMLLLVPDIVANIFGRGNARRAAQRVFGMLQDKRLNQQLILRSLDELFDALFTLPDKVPAG